MSAQQKARAAWGAELPLWILRLARACDSTSQADVARKIELSTAYVSHAINRTDHRSYDPVKQSFELAFNPQPINCPTMGDIDYSACKAAYTRPFSAANSRRVQQYKACITCSNNRSKKQ